MSTSSTRLGLYIPALGDQANIVTTYGDWVDDIDAAVGNQVFTASTRPASGFSGKSIWETDTNAVLVWNGSAWRYATPPVASNLSTVIGTHNGLLGMQTSDNSLKRWNGSSWTSISGTTPASANLYHAEFTTTTSIPNNTDFWPLFNSQVTTSSYVTMVNPGDGESYFTLNSTGIYEVQAQAVWATNTSGTRHLSVNSGTNGNVRYATNEISATSAGFATPNLAFTRSFTAGQQIQMVVNQNSGGALNMLPTAKGVKTWITIRFIG